MAYVLKSVHGDVSLWKYKDHGYRHHMLVCDYCGVRLQSFRRAWNETVQVNLLVPLANHTTGNRTNTHLPPVCRKRLQSGLENKCLRTLSDMLFWYPTHLRPCVYATLSDDHDRTLKRWYGLAIDRKEEEIKMNKLSK
jgi:hypothetical protein